MKHIKTLGLLALALMALTAVVGVSSASAFTKFTAGKVGAELETTTLEEHVFKVTGSPVECEILKFEGKTEALESTAQMVTPKYEKCTAFGLPATVTNENCTYNLTINGEVHVEPLSGTTCNFLIKASSIFGECLVDVTGPQTLGGVSYANGANSDLVVTINSTGISDHVTKRSGICPLEVGTHTNATYTGKSTVKATGTTLAVS